MKSCTQRLLFRALCLVFAAATSWGSLNVSERSCAARNLPQNSVLACQKKLQNDLTGETQTAVRIACHLLFCFSFFPHFCEQLISLIFGLLHWQTEQTADAILDWSVFLHDKSVDGEIVAADLCDRHKSLKGFKCFLKMYFKLLTVGKSCSGGTQARVQWGVWS